MYEKESMKELKQSVQKYMKEKGSEELEKENLEKEYTLMVE